MKIKSICLIACCTFLTGCVFSSNNFSKFKDKLGVTMPSKYKKVFKASETSIDSNLKYDIYEVEEEWKLDYTIQYQSDFEDEFNLEKYINLINEYQPLHISSEYYIPYSSSLDWVCKREIGETRNYEWLLIYDKQTKLLYALDSTHQWLHQAIPNNN